VCSSKQQHSGTGWHRLVRPCAVYRVEIHSCSKINLIPLAATIAATATTPATATIEIVVVVLVLCLGDDEFTSLLLSVVFQCPCYGTALVFWVRVYREGREEARHAPFYRAWLFLLRLGLFLFNFASHTRRHDDSQTGCCFFFSLLLGKISSSSLSSLTSFFIVDDDDDVFVIPTMAAILFA
jgi:hypothetical protein